MNRNKKWLQMCGWLALVISAGFFTLQIGYLFVSERYNVEYVDDRLFYLINIACVLFLALAFLLLVSLTKKLKLIGGSMLFFFIAVHLFMLVSGNQKVNNIMSISPDWKNVLSIKEHTEAGNAFYYREYYGILARPMEKLPYETDGNFKVEWLAHDIAAVTYETKDDKVQQFIGTYGDRGGGISYYYVWAEIQGRWQGDGISVESGPEGITVMENGETEHFSWEETQQFGTLAIVLMKNDEAIWTISLDETFEVHPEASRPTVGTIKIYEAMMEENEPVTLEYSGAY